MPETLYDVVAVNLSNNRVRLIAENKTESNAEAIVSMAVMRRGVDEEFFIEVKSGKYKNGDKWLGKRGYNSVADGQQEG